MAFQKQAKKFLRRSLAVDADIQEDEYLTHSTSLLPSPVTSAHSASAISSISWSGTTRGMNTGLSTSEVLNGAANRILHSSFYRGLYLVMVVLSLVSVSMSLVDPCPSGWFYVLEAVVNLTMIVEVSIRFIALGKHYWKSVWNILDLVMVALCAMTLVYLLFGECSMARATEAVLDTILLVVRNGIQFSRLVLMIRKNRRHLSSRPGNIDFESVQSANVISPNNADIGVVHASSRYMDSEDDDDF
ncbi:hypothetical protein SeMB42_g06146 [Synchytrium endobioticum]|uniref:Ion transport domain-containing protein n=1 Tax=Synchytrium endobioticum TaxID=286115 RepID=A0A507DAD0_9FUNG|nr:hypothetical protein SeMB42_g06146 [Synchytrium endobioticum]TPX48351.1 hypothetical protein SeLEV6574_g02102 [Synchytrium endobioticum]